MNRFLALLALLSPAAALWPAAPLAQAFIGPEACKGCHPSAHDAWRETAHARAQESLPPKSRKDPRCLTCHGPESEKGLSGVSCESCHGAGQHYAARHVMRDPELARLVGLVIPDERTCFRCHTESAPSLARFDPRTRMKLIAHWRELPQKAP